MERQESQQASRRLGSQKQSRRLGSAFQRQNNEDDDFERMIDTVLFTPEKGRRPVSKRESAGIASRQGARINDLNASLGTIDVETRQYMNMLKQGNRLNLTNNNEQIKLMSQSLRTKLSDLLKDQTDVRVLQQRGLPIVPKQYQMPFINSNDKGKNQPICANDAHIKATNNGFKRNALGGFFAH